MRCPRRIIFHFARLKWMEMFSPGKFISEKNIEQDPIAQFSNWYNEARKMGIPFYEAMTLSTSTIDGKPSARVVLLKGYDENGFVFFTNDCSRKGKELADNNLAALTFFWSKTGKQVRIEGSVQKILSAESDEYFSSRPRGSQISAWASEQSSPISSRAELLEKKRELKQYYQGKSIPRPAYWVGYRVTPDQMEFWQNRPNRLHDRFLFTRKNSVWHMTRLAP